MELLLNLIVTGAVTGSIYSLLAAGLVLSYSATGIFNLGYGAVAFTAAFLYFELNTGLGWSVLPSAATTVLVFAPLLGLVLDRTVFRALARASDAAKIMGTVGLLIALPAGAKLIVRILVEGFGFDLPLGDTVYITPGIGPSPAENWRLPGGININSNQVIVFAAAVLSCAALWVLLRRTRLGLTMRAVVDRPDLARLRGIDSDRNRSLGWVFGCMLASVAGVVGAPVFNSLLPSTYTLAVFAAITAAVLGGLRSIPLAFAGGLLLGVLQNLVVGYASFADGIKGFNASVPFVLLLIGLVFLSRERGRRAGWLSEEAPPKERHESAIWRRVLPPAAGLAAVLFFALFVTDEFWLGLIVRGLALGLVFLSLVIVTGLGGMISLAQAAFVTGSGLTIGLLVNRFDVPFVVALLGGVAVATVLGVLVALPAMRVGGLSLALATLALAFLGEQVLFVYEPFSNGQEGWVITPPHIGPWDLSDVRTLAVVVTVLVGLVMAYIGYLRRSPAGRAVAAVRSGETAAATAGISPTTVKLRLFAVSAAIAGLGGGMLAIFDQRVNNEATPAIAGLTWLAAVVLFGVRRPGGAIAAGLLVSVFPAVLANGLHWPGALSLLDWDGTTSTFVPDVLFGLGAIQLAKNPDGLFAFVEAAWAHRRFGRRQPAAAPTTTDSTLARTSARETSPAVAPAPASRTAPGPLLSLEGLVSGYGQVTVLRGVDLAVRAGSVHVLLGANGAGKSTLCSSVSGLLAPWSGRIVFDGEDISRMSVHARARHGLVVAPESRGVFPGLSVQENLDIWLPSREDQARVFERYPILGERRRLPAGNLSGGEQQMLTLAPLLIRPPKLLIADEPTLGLAPSIVSTVTEVFGELRDSGTALLLVEEKAFEVLDIADDVTFLELGRATWSGPRAQVDESRLASAYLGAAVDPKTSV